MLNQLLYDKIINVTLYKKEERQQVIRIFRTLSYGETRVKGKRVLFAHGGDDIKTSYTDESGEGYTYGITSTIEFYEGSFYYTYTNYRNGKDRYVKHFAKGPLYTFNTMEEMKKGLHPDGSLMNTGDRAYVVETRKTWSAVVLGSTDAFTERTNTETIIAQDVMAITCPENGLKPDITFSVNMLQGQGCYKAVLRIKNLNIKNEDIRLWDKMEITAGYRSGTQARFICPIFTSYIESPNPDGVTVFEGLTVGQIESVMYNKLIEIHFQQEKMTLDSLIRQVAPGILGDTIVVKCTIPDKWLAAEINISKQVVYAENGLAVLNWLQTTISSIIEELSGHSASSLVQLSGTTLSVMIINGENATTVSTEDIVPLDMVSGATYNGTALTVEAPWNPALKPGALFYMPPQFIHGSRLPNMLSEKDYKNKDNLYRALTMSIMFGTTDGNNKMSILAVPSQYAGRTSIQETTDMTPEKYLALRASEQAISQGDVIPIHVGELAGVEKAAMKVVTKQTGVTMFDAHKNLPGFSFITMVIDRDITGSCLSVIGQYYCYDWGNGPKLDSAKKGTSSPAGRYFVPIDQLQSISTLAAEHPQYGGIPCATLWWPLIAIATYWRWQEDEASGTSNNWMHINLDNPDYIVNGKSLYIPVFSSYDALRVVKDVFKDAYRDYKHKYESYSKQWRAMYYMLGGTDEL